MRLRFVALVTAGLLALTAVGCNSADKSPPARSTPASPQKAANPQQIQSVTADGVRRISTAELQQKLQTNEAVVIDVRTEASYNASHIKGAKLIPHTEIGKRANELPRDKLIVTYCSWPAEQTSAGAVASLRTVGIQNAAALLGGFEAWKNAGLPIQSKQ